MEAKLGRYVTGFDSSNQSFRQIFRGHANILQGAPGLAIGCLGFFWCRLFLCVGGCGFFGVVGCFVALFYFFFVIILNQFLGLSFIFSKSAKTYSGADEP